MTPNQKYEDLRSWLEAAGQPGCEFPIQNLPYCAFSVGEETHIGIGIGDSVLDLNSVAHSGLLDGLPTDVREACRAPYLNPLMACSVEERAELRTKLTTLLSEGAEKNNVNAVKSCLHKIADMQFRRPVQIGDYTDFYTSIHHATNVGRLFRPDNPLLPNYKYVPIGYHGRASSIVVSGARVIRPSGQTMPSGASAPTFGPSKQLDYELEVGTYIALGNALGKPIPIEEAEQHIFGLTLVNDWSARDIQAWEYQPLGPFLGKSFITSVSPWVVPMEALAPFRMALAERPTGDPAPLPYLTPEDREHAAFDVQLEVYLLTHAMRDAGQTPFRVSAGNLKELYWSFAQMIAHHTSNGCNLQTGDLLASGTVSGPEEGSQGSLLELTRRGSSPLQLPSGEQRSFLQDGDEVIFRAFCEASGRYRIGFGECRGTVQHAHA